MERKYPLIVQTWAVGRGSTLLAGLWADGEAMKWAKREVLSWNDLHAAVPEKPASHRAERGGAVLFGVIRSRRGGEDFRRDYAEIRAVLLDQQALPIDEIRLARDLLAFPLEDGGLGADLRISVPVSEIAAPAEQGKPRRERRRVFRTLAFVLLLLCATAAFRFLRPEVFLAGEGADPDKIAGAKSKESKVPNTPTDKTAGSGPEARSKFAVDFRIHDSAGERIDPAQAKIQCNVRDAGAQKFEFSREDEVSLALVLSNEKAWRFRTWEFSESLEFAEGGKQETAIRVRFGRPTTVAAICDKTDEHREWESALREWERSSLDAWRSVNKGDLEKANLDLKEFVERGESHRENAGDLGIAFPEECEKKLRIARRRLESLGEFFRLVGCEELQFDFRREENLWKAFEKLPNPPAIEWKLIGEGFEEIRNFNLDVWKRQNPGWSVSLNDATLSATFRGNLKDVKIWEWKNRIESIDCKFRERTEKCTVSMDLGKSKMEVQAKRFGNFEKDMASTWKFMEIDQRCIDALRAHVRGELLKMEAEE